LRLALRTGSRFPEAVADDGVDEHPIDAAVEEVPAVARIRRKLHKARELVEQQISDRRLWVIQQDLESAYRSIREDLYFDVGYTFGLVTGRSEPRLSRAARHLAREIRTAALLAKLPPTDTLAALQETTRAILRLNVIGRRR
jgi:hypothetical protein